MRIVKSVETYALVYLPNIKKAAGSTKYMNMQNNIDMIVISIYINLNIDDNDIENIKNLKIFFGSESASNFVHK